MKTGRIHHPKVRREKDPFFPPVKIQDLLLRFFKNFSACILSTVFSFSVLSRIRPECSVTQALAKPSISIVNFDWLSESFSSKKRVDEQSYLRSSSNGTAASTDNAQPASPDAPQSKKRTARDRAKVAKQTTKDDGIQEEEEDDGPAKKAKVETNDLEEAETKFKVKKGKDGQKASSAQLNVPVDEGVPNAGERSNPAPKFQCHAHTRIFSFRKGLY
jgi:hypothetical protein